MKLTRQQVTNRGLWCDALESGKYQQGKRRLRTTEGFCCLGVGADVLEPDGWSDEANFGDENNPGYQHRTAGSGTLTETFEPRFGFEAEGDVNRPDPDSQKALWMKNDLGGKTFAEIAAYIRERTALAEVID